jgi:hypothetical protein
LAGPQQHPVPVSRRLALISAFVGFLALTVSLIVLAWADSNIWWYVIQAMAAYLGSELMVAIYDHFIKPSKKIHFALQFFFFVEFVVVGAFIVGELAKSGIAFGLFDEPLSIGLITFVLLIALLPVFLYIDFFARGRYRFEPYQPLDSSMVNTVIFIWIVVEIILILAIIDVHQ